MYKKSNPKNKNITVRVNDKQFREFKELASSHNLSVSEWANYILSQHKNDYCKKTTIDALALDIEIELAALELIENILKKFQIETNPSENYRSHGYLSKLILATKVLDMTTFTSDEYIDRLINNYLS